MIDLRQYPALLRRQPSALLLGAQLLGVVLYPLMEGHASGQMVLAMFGRLRFPKRKSDGGLTKKLEKPALCGKCGRYIIGSGECDCTKPPASKG